MPNVIIVGRNRAGKSVRAEAIVHDAGHLRAAFGTLPRCVINEERIRRHHVRRDDSWRVVEAVFEFDKDLEALSNVSHEGRVLLIDGITVYLNEIAKRYGANTLGQASDALCELTYALHCPWVLVDVDYETALIGALAGVADAAAGVRRALLQRADTHYLWMGAQVE